MSQHRHALDERLRAYLLASQPREHEELRRLRELTQTLPNGRMQILPEQGHFLALLVKLTGARRVLEVGTLTGYSAMSLALALPDDGKLISCDIDADMVAIGRPFWERAGVSHKVETIIGPALTTVTELAGHAASSFDLAFIDADKPSYDGYYEMSLRLVRPGGLIVLDNMLWRGEAADPTNLDARTVSVRRLNAKIADDERVDRVMLPIGDGMTLARRRR
jgi:O-methyltransferase